MRHPKASFGCGAALVSFVVLVADSTVHAAILEGRTMAAQRDHQESMTSPRSTFNSPPFVVGPGVELEDFGASQFPVMLSPIIDVDVADTTILVTLVVDQPFSMLERFRFQDDTPNTFPLFQNVFVDPSTNWAGFTPNKLLLSSNEFIFLNVSELSGQAGQFILLNVTPEPATAMMLLPILGVFAAIRRRL
jgi:hypothetical protein